MLDFSKDTDHFIKAIKLICFDLLFSQYLAYRFANKNAVTSQ